MGCIRSVVIPDVGITHEPHDPLDLLADLLETFSPDGRHNHIGWRPSLNHMRNRHGGFASYAIRRQDHLVYQGAHLARSQAPGDRAPGDRGRQAH